MHEEHILPKLAHFGCIAAISCHEGAFLPLGVLLGMHQGDILPGIRPPLVCSECASRVLHSKGASSSVRNEPRKCFVQECSPSPVRECSSKMLRLGPFVCAGERKVVIAVLCPRRSTASVPWGSGRCGAAEFRVLDVAVDAMAAERAEHERVQVQVRARMPLLPRRCRVLAGDSDYRVLHGVDVLGHCVKRGVGERLGRHVKKDFVERYCHGASSLRALTAAMRIARKRNRSPQNGAGRDDGSSQCSLLW